MKKAVPQGFTLLELVITIAIGAILAILALPSFTKYLAMTRINQGATSVLAGFNTARNMALSNNTYVAVDPASCNGAASFAYGVYVWLPAMNGAVADSASPPSLATDPRLVTGTPMADGAACSLGNRITTTPAANSYYRYNAGGRIETATSRTAGGWTNTVAAAAQSVKFCDTGLAVPTGAAINISVSGRVAIQSGATCP